MTVPCNIKFLVEGEEEIGSVHVGEYLASYHDDLACDGVIWEFGYVNEQNIPIITLGMKGLLFVDNFYSGLTAMLIQALQS